MFLFSPFVPSDPPARRCDVQPAAAAFLHPIGWLILLTLAARLLFAVSLGLGIDESYMVASGRHLHLSYFDHPPLSWWMAWGSAHVFGTDAPWAVRLPFVLMFSLTTWLMFQLTRRLYGDHAGLWAALLLNLSPVFGVTTGSWVLPDGPLMAALLGMVFCLWRAFDAPRGGWWWWLGVGLCGGLALLSKYSAILVIGGAVLYGLTQPALRRWFLRPQPYVGGALALAIFSPVLVWNAEHGWVSLLFQGGRAMVARMHPLGPLATLGGEAVFVLPWIWVPMMIYGVRAGLRGPQGDARGWFLICLATPTILLFTVVSLWNHVLFHWAVPGYLLLFPLLGAAIGESARLRRLARPVAIATAAATLGALALIGSEVRFNWLPTVIDDFAFGTDPDINAVDWTSIRTDLAARNLLHRTDLTIAALRWHDAGKIDYALDGVAPVLCLGPDPREYGLIHHGWFQIGHDMLLIAPRDNLADIERHFGRSFDEIEALPPIMLRHAGRPTMLIPMFLGRNLHPGGLSALPG